MSITQAVTPLRMIFWGGLLCIFDFSFSSASSINGQAPTGFRFDILNDFVGMLLITVGISKLSAFATSANSAKLLLGDDFRLPMRFVFICSVLNCFEALVQHFIFATPTIWDIFSQLLALATLVAVVLFCNSMGRMSQAFGLQRSEESWRTTQMLAIILWVIPLGILRLAGLGAMLTGQPFRWDIGIFVIPILAVMIVPLIHLFISTSRMRHEAEEYPYDNDMTELKRL